MDDDEEKRALKGKVHSFAGGHGYIISDDGVAYTVHVSAIDPSESTSGGAKPLSAGDAVEFNAPGEPFDDTAIDVRKIGRKPGAG